VELDLGENALDCRKLVFQSFSFGDVAYIRFQAVCCSQWGQIPHVLAQNAGHLSENTLALYSGWVGQVHVLLETILYRVRTASIVGQLIWGSVGLLFPIRSAAPCRRTFRHVQGVLCHPPRTAAQENPTNHCSKPGTQVERSLTQPRTPHQISLQEWPE